MLNKLNEYKKDLVKLIDSKKMFLNKRKESLDLENLDIRKVAEINELKVEIKTLKYVLSDLENL